jgi:hypothetical protein
MGEKAAKVATSRPVGSPREAVAPAERAVARAPQAQQAPPDAVAEEERALVAPVATVEAWRAEE